ncbi:hypothetical protein ACFQV4_16610 [Streptomyces thermocarboxydus]
MHYPDHQWSEVIAAWEEAMRRVRPAAVNGLGKDLQHYLDFERAQSVFPDVMRAAQSLEQAYSQKNLDEATAEVDRRCARLRVRWDYGACLGRRRSSGHCSAG